MGLLDNWFSRLKKNAIAGASDAEILIEAARRRGVDNSSYGSIVLQQKNLREQTLREWKNAVASATDPETPDRVQLAELYDNMMIDNHLASVVESRILFCQRSKFKLVDANGTESQELSKLFERPWFDELIYKVLFSKFQGTTLLELYETNDDNELEAVNEIPQPYFNPVKGIVMANPGDSTGDYYRDSPYVVQVGRDFDLGMFEKLAPIVLAKKIGWGALLDYVDKYGVPPLIIKTDREDAARLNELYEAGLNFKNNTVLVMRGNETVDTPAVQGQGTSPFGDLHTRADEQISKRVLGGSGLTDEKSFVGSSEIQFRLAKDRFESDKLFFKYQFNAKIRPILINLSPVYAPLHNYRFEWDDSESMDMKEYVSSVVQLANVFELDHAEVAKKTGLPIIGLRQGGAPGEEFGL